MGNINYEKMGIYLVVIATLYMFWQSQMTITNQMADIRERVKALEVTKCP